MLYAITDKNRVRIGVHECRPMQIATYLRSLPIQGAPYSVAIRNQSLINRAYMLGLNHRFASGVIGGFGLGELIHLAIRGFM